MASTYTVNLGIEKIGTGEQSGTWGNTTNTNFDLIDQAVNGAVTVTLASAGTSGSPNTLAITDGASSDGRNKFIEFADGADLGATAYIQLTPNDAEKIVHMRNSLSGGRSVIVFQGTYNASNDFEIPNGKDVVLKFDGAGASATVTDVFTDLQATAITTPDLTATTADINGGTIDGATIGGASAAAGTFTNLTATGTTTLAGASTTATISFPDGVGAYFGAGNDLQIYHSGTESIIADAGTGNLNLRGQNQIVLATASGSETYAAFNVNGASELYYDNAKKLATTATGIDVTGSVEADGASVSGDAYFGANMYVQSVDGTNAFYVTRYGTVTTESAKFTLDDNDLIINSIQDEQYGGYTFKATHNGVGTANRLDIANNGDISFYEDTGTTPKFFWDSSAESLGIGTTSPYSNLTVIPSTNPTSVATATQVSIGEASANSAYALKVGYFLESGAYKSSIQSIAGGSGGTLVLNGDGGNVGIGTTSPAYKLDISTSSTSAFRVTGPANVTSDLTDGTITLRQQIGAEGAIGTLGAHAFIFRTNNTERMRITSAGNVGIGTSSPYAKTVVALAPTVTATTVNETADFADQFVIANSGTSTNGDRLPLIFNLGADDTDGISAGIVALREASGWNTALSFWTNNVTAGAEGTDAIQEKMRITSAGNVGIGTASPSRKTSIFDSVDGYNLELSQTSAYNSGYQSGIVFSAKYNVSGAVTDLASIRGGKENTTDDNFAGNLRFYTRTNGGSDTERMRIDSSGNVGIGRTTMDERLHIQNGNDAIKFKASNASGGYATFGLDSAATSDGRITWTNALIFGASGSERMRIDSSGNLLVGITAPYNSSGTTINAAGLVYASADQDRSGQFDRTTNDGEIVRFSKAGTTVGSIGTVSGYLGIASGDTGLLFRAPYDDILPYTSTGNTAVDAAIDIGDGSFRFKDLYLSGSVKVPAASKGIEYSSTAFMTPENNVTGAEISTPGAFVVKTGATPAERMRIDSSGNLLVGTQTPLGRVTVVGSAGSSISMAIDSNASYGEIQTYNSAPLYLNRQGNNVVVNSGGGNLTVGTTASGFNGQGLPLVVGSGSGNTGMTIYSGAAGYGTIQFADAETTGAGSYAGVVSYNHASGFMYFSTNASERMRIDSSGNLLVGTTSRIGSGSYGLHEIRGDNGSGGSSVLVVYNSNAADAATALNAIKNSATTTSSQRFIQFYADAGSTAMGGIVGNGASNVQFAAISDAREKTNIESISGSLNKINALNPVEFDWIASGEHVNAGFVAQEVEQVFPEFVVENMAGEGQEARKGLTGGMTGGIVAHLVKAIQEQQEIIDDLRARVAQLEGA